MLSWLTAWSVRFRYFVVALAVGLMILGVSRLPSMPVNVLPETAPVVVGVQTEALGLSAPEVESLVTVPLEKNLLEGVLGVTDVTSDSIPGLSAIQLHFAPGTNLYQARQLVQERLTSAFILPNVSKPPVMLQPVSSTANVMVVGLTSRALSQIDLSVLARWTLVPRLLGVPGVANVSTFGQADLQLQVLVNPAVLAAHHLMVADVVDATGNSQLVTPLSYLEGSTPGADGFLETPNQRITIRHALPFGTPANLGQIPLETVNGKPLLLGSLATVVDGNQPLIGDALNGTKSNGLLLVVQKLPNASATSVTKGLDQALSQLKPALAGVHVDSTLFRPASYLSSAGSNDRLAIIVAAALALLALLLLLLSVRFAVVCVVAIGISLISATVVLQALGYTFSSIVLLGLLLALAVVVDDAVSSTAGVMARLGKTANGQVQPVTSRVVSAYREFGQTFTGASVAALVCLVPLFAATGLTATFLRPMVVAAGLAVITSMIVALVISPALAAMLLAAGTKRAPRGLAVTRRLRAAYAAVLRRVLAISAWRLAAVCVLAIGVLAFTLPMLRPGPPAFQDRDLDVTWTGAPGMSLTELNRITALADSELLATPGVQQVSATLGRAMTSDQTGNTNTGHIWVQLKPDADYGPTVAAVQSIVAGTPGIRGTVSTYEADSMAGVLSAPPRHVDVRVSGPDLSQLTTIAGQIRSMMSRVHGLGPPHVQLPVMQPAVNVEVNSNAAKLYGLTPGAVRREAGTLLLGLTVGNFFEQQKVFDVVVKAEPNLTSNLSSVQNLLIDDGVGGQVRLGTVATVSLAAQPQDIQHDQFSPFLDITAPVSSGDARSADAAIDSGLSNISFPLQYHAVLQTQSSGGTSRVQLLSFILAALFGIVLIAQAAIGSWRLALLAIAAVLPPVAAGAAVALGIGSTSLSAAAGVLAVLVIALRQAIGIAGRIRRRQVAGGGGLSRDLLVAAAGESAGSVIVSALVTILILMPFIVIGETAGTESIHGAAVVIVCGLLVATLVNLLLLPAAALMTERASPGPPPGIQEPVPGDRPAVPAPADPVG